MNTYYTVTNYLKTILQENIDVNTVIFGKQNELDLYKKTIFCLAHVIPTGSSFNRVTAVYKFRIIVLDQRDISKKPEIDKYEGNDNQIHNLNLTDNIIRHFIMKLLMQYNEYDIELVNYTDAEPLILSGNNLLDGWFVDITVQIPNNLSVC